MTTTAPPPGEYLLGSTEDERHRLIAQGEVYRDLGAALLDRIGVAPGWTALDLGCGPLGVLDLLAERAGPEGVVGVDREAPMLEMARRSVAERGHPGVRLVRGDAADTGLPDASFDLVHERFVLVNVPNPEEVVAEMVRLARPGGWVALQDADGSTWTCEPPHPAWDRLAAAVFEAWQANGLDREIGRRLGTMLRAAGLVDVEVSPNLHLFRAGHPSQRLMLTMAERFRPRVLAAGAFTTEAELDAVLGEVAAHLDDPATAVVHYAFWQAWGRRPD
jgi:ubiquinone/menaquinone biosynthesis C-methylase UbiE